MNRQIALALTLLFFCPKPCHADTFLMKSGQQVTGKLVEKKGDKYIVKEQGSGEMLELPVFQVSIADIDPDSAAAPKGTLSILSGPDTGNKDDNSRNEGVIIIAPPQKSATPEVPLLAKSGILKDAHDTVELSNQRTAQTIEVLNQMKDVADSANTD